MTIQYSNGYVAGLVDTQDPSFPLSYPASQGSPDQYLSNDGAGNLSWVSGKIKARVTSQFNVSNSNALANIPGLTVNVKAGRTYYFEVILFTTSNAAGGIQCAIAGTATATAIVYEGFSSNNNALGGQARVTALGAAVAAITAVTASLVWITGTITVNAAGTLTVQFAQNAANAAASSVLIGSWFGVEDAT